MTTCSCTCSPAFEKSVDSEGVREYQSSAAMEVRPEDKETTIQTLAGVDNLGIRCETVEWKVRSVIAPKQPARNMQA
jgi:hypothetical protein